ncbi:MAG: phosphoenolpyruvate carboxykinase (ATP), partial [Hyphomicrobiales bacterium]|nr:phosphoenolpyruvate carboxykinase (ATP) [Hyphomicrobiales bacterium]
MTQLGDFNPAYGADKFGFKDLKQVAYNFEAPFLYEEAMQRREAILAKGGALVAETGQHTGRSPKDKFVV